MCPDHKQMWTFWPIFSMEYDTQKKFYLIVTGLKNAFFHASTKQLSDHDHDNCSER